jgi:hypothetical protein
VGGSSVELENYALQTATDRQQLFLDLKEAREVFYGGAAGGGKLLPLDTPIPTPTGWAEMGALREGDWVFDERGVPCQVLEAYAVEAPETSYRLTFDDGSQIDAGGEHQWLTFDAKELAALTRRDPEWRARRRARRESRATGIKSKMFTDAIIARNMANPPTALPAPAGTVRTTGEIYQSLYTDAGRANHAIPVSRALDLVDADLALDPYCLGAWLGDGTCGGGGFTGIDPIIWMQFEKHGFDVSHNRNGKSHHVKALCRPLREVGVLSRKHIPNAYKRGSRQQRLDLLCGLMDTDGTVCDSGSVEFTNTNKDIIDGVYELITSLGWKSRVVEGRAMLNGKDCGAKWDIKWTPSDYVFRLPRKREKQKLATRRTTKFRYIVDCRVIPNVPMRCIRVGSPSHLYLAGRQMIPTHNSSCLLMAALEYVKVKGYSALLLRRTYADLSKPGALMDRAHQWLKQTTAKWNEQKKQWTFPEGATLTFGYLESENDKYQYQGAEYQFIGFDELTQFTESAYTYLFSRLRRLKDSEIPIRMRSASNPGGLGARWVQERFVPDDFTPEQAIEPRVFWKEGVNVDGQVVRRAFIPARLDDNPHLDRIEYAQSLNELDAVTREQLLKGDWQIRERGNIFRMFEDGVHGRHVITWGQFEKLIGVRHIPTHWLGAHGHDPGFDPDPRAAVWNFVAAQNSPLAGDVFCIRELYANRMTVDDFAEEVKRAESVLNESARIGMRTIGHEASSEQATLSQKHKLNYAKLKPDANGGIAQWRHALRITDLDKPHPFKPYLKGRPHFYVVVADEEIQYPKTSKGMVNFRAEIAAYKYIDGSPSVQRGMPKIVPYDFFNHLMDAQRNIAQNWFAASLPLTYVEKMREAVPALKDLDAKLIESKTLNPQDQMKYFHLEGMAKKRLGAQIQRAVDAEELDWMEG